MADKTKTSKQLKLVAQFADGDDRTLAVDAPKSTLAKANIVNDEFIASAKAVLIGDKTGAEFTKWKSAKIHESETVYLDITSF